MKKKEIKKYNIKKLFNILIIVIIIIVTIHSLYTSIGFAALIERIKVFYMTLF